MDVDKIIKKLEGVIENLEDENYVWVHFSLKNCDCPICKIKEVVKELRAKAGW